MLRLGWRLDSRRRDGGEANVTCKLSDTRLWVATSTHGVECKDTIVNLWLWVSWMLIWLAKRCEAGDGGRSFGDTTGMQTDSRPGLQVVVQPAGFKFRRGALCSEMDSRAEASWSYFIVLFLPYSLIHCYSSMLLWMDFGMKGFFLCFL